MNLIIKFLGKQTSEDLSFMTEEFAIEFVKNLDKGGDPVNLHDKFTLKNPLLLDILQWLLRLNPYFRCSASELLKNPIFDKVRNPILEKSAPFKIKLSIDKDEAFDYENGNSPIFSLKDYQAMILE